MKAVDIAEEMSDPKVTRVADVAITAVEWLWPGRLPLGKLAVLDGDPALGKSTLMMDLAARVTTGSPLPDGHRPEPAAVVLLSAEDAIDDTIRPRLEAAGADTSQVFVFEGVELDQHTMRPPSIPADLDHLERMVAHRKAKFVVIDVLSAFLGSHVDSYRDQDVRAALMPLARVAERTGAAVVVLRHLSKTGGTNAIYRGGGSIGIIGAARAGLLVAPDPEDDTRRILAVTKSNLAAMPQALAYRLVGDEQYACARIQWEGTTDHKAGDLLATPDTEERSARDEAVEFLLDVLADGPVPSKQIDKLRRDAGIAERTLKRAKDKAGVETYREGFGAAGLWYWRLRIAGHESSIEGLQGHVQNTAPFDLLCGQKASNGQGDDA
jgi:RecA-family ATPase